LDQFAYQGDRVIRIRTLTGDYSRVTSLAGAAGIVALGMLVAPTAFAVPGFAQQTGYACAQCHTVAFGPALTAYGREFKLNGYVFGDASRALPLSVMVQGGFTHTGEAQPDAPAPHFARNENASVDQVSLFYSGRISEHAGAFVQLTYDGEERHAHWDNLDIRYARAFTLGGKAAVVGVTLNNNPSAQDLWNSTPVWGFPYISSGLAPGPAAGPLIEGLGQAVIGATAYTMIDGRYYLEFGGYKSMSDRWLGNVGLDADNNAHVVGFAPYWRARLQLAPEPHDLSVGLFGLDTRVQPDPALAATDRYTDIGLDASYQYTPRSAHALAANVSLLHERRRLEASYAAGASDSADDHLVALKGDVTYTYDQTWAGTLGLFAIGGAVNNALYGGPAPLGGSASGSPDSRGYVLQADYIPFGKLQSYARPYLNLRVGLQYTGYTKFNGGTSNYDGYGRSASANNTLFAFLWFIL
jgi:hypothetical protein